MNTRKFRSSVLLSEELQTPELKLPVPGIPMLPPGIVAPEPQTLRYDSATKLYGIGNFNDTAEGEHDGFYLRETINRTPLQGLPPEVVEYTVVVERTVRSSDEFQIASGEISKFVAELDKFWVYSAGEPLNPIVKRLSFGRSIAGWSHNEVAVRDYLV
ncbi:MAG: hypothetical protein M3Z64_07155, partial [Verrucomicrobiota bacterium]|nr:hypothetical protein [Verrucomicrobiota bacterium]